MRARVRCVALTLLVLTLGAAGTATAQDRPNILVIWGDDIGQWNISAYNRGSMGYMTPNIDRIAAEGILFTDAYGENSCTAGRSAFMTGQSPFRTGLTKVGFPGATQGLQPEDPTIAEMLKPLGYRTAQFGKNHLGDLDEHLPTNHGFDEFYGNLYHLNAEEEPENPDYPADFVTGDGRTMAERYGPRGVIHSRADGQIQDTGPLTKKRMETIDAEFLEGALGFIDQANDAGEPFFVWFASTRMHVWTRLTPEAEGVTGQGVYADGMVEHDGHVGQLLDKLDELGITENTIVMYATDNGAELMSWPDGGTIPWKGEKNTTWEGGFRVPMMIRWPGTIAAGQVSNDIIEMTDWLPTLVSAAGNPNVKQQLLDGTTADGKSFNVHLDGYDFMPYFRGAVESGPRMEKFYFTDDGSLSALRYGDWKVMFTVQDAHGLEVWSNPYRILRAPLITNLRQDPFERAHVEGMEFDRWYFDHVFLLGPAAGYVGEFLQTFVQFPPRQRPGSFTIDGALEMLQSQGSNGR
ncbi:MAG: arylsulfatase [Acidimicrobiia bacterium]